MKVFIVSLLFSASFVTSVSVTFAQQDPSYQKLVQEIEALKEQFLTLQSQLQTVENVEKMKLSAELADAKAKLINAEFGRFERELRDSNDGWLKTWILIFLAFISAVGITILSVMWNNFKSTIDLLIADEVGKRANRHHYPISYVE